MSLFLLFAILTFPLVIESFDLTCKSEYIFLRYVNFKIQKYADAVIFLYCQPLYKYLMQIGI